MAAAEDTSNGRVAQALVEALRHEFELWREQVQADLKPLIKQVTAHEEMSKSHCHELFNQAGSRIQAVETDVKQIKDSSQTFDARRFAIIALIIASVLSLGGSVMGAYLISRLIPH